MTATDAPDDTPQPVRSPAATDEPAGPTGRPHDAKKRWSWHPLQAIVLVVMVFVISQFSAFLLAEGILRSLVRLTGLHSPSLAEGKTIPQFLAIMLAELFVILGVRLLLRRRGIGFRELGFGRPGARDFWLPALGIVVYFGSFMLLSAVVKALVPGIDLNQKQDIGFDDATGPWLLALVFVALVIMAPLAEEVLFRGFLFGSLRRRMSFAAATLLTSFFFGAAHLLGGEKGASLLWIAGIDTLVLSVVLCWLREKSGRLWSSVMLHAAKNTVAFIVLFIIGSR